MISSRKVQNAFKVKKLFIKLAVLTLMFNAHLSQAKETSVGNNLIIQLYQFHSSTLIYE